jgi:hypothetical protein
VSLVRVATTGLVAAENQNPSPQWLPSDLSGLGGWWDASDAATVHATAGAVDSWDDKSGNGHTLTATTTARPTTGTRTLNSKNVFDYDGTTDNLRNAAWTVTDPYTICVVALNDSGANATTQSMVGSVATAAGGRLQKTTGNAWAISSGSTLSAGTVDTSAHTFIALIKSGATAAVLSIDGAETTGQSGTNDYNGFGVGAAIFGGPTEFWNGTIAEVIVYTVSKDATSRASLYTYCKAKWGTP